MHADMELLEDFRHQLIMRWDHAKVTVPVYASQFRDMALKVEHTLNAHTAAQWGLARDLAVRCTAMSALVALDAYEERRQDGSAEWTRSYAAEYEALRRLAVVGSACDESQLEE